MFVSTAAEYNDSEVLYHQCVLAILYAFQQQDTTARAGALLAWNKQNTHAIQRQGEGKMSKTIVSCYYNPII